jgi:hypothetical protein
MRRKPHVHKRRTMMKRWFTIPALLLALGLTGGLIGCDDGTLHSRDLEVDDDEIKTTDTTVRERKDGLIEIEKRTVERDLDDGKVETEVERDVRGAVDD